MDVPPTRVCLVPTVDRRPDHSLQGSSMVRYGCTILDLVRVTLDLTLTKSRVVKKKNIIYFRCNSGLGPGQVQSCQKCEFTCDAYLHIRTLRWMYPDARAWSERASTDNRVTCQCFSMFFNVFQCFSMFFNVFQCFYNSGLGQGQVQSCQKCEFACDAYLDIRTLIWMFLQHACPVPTVDRGPDHTLQGSSMVRCGCTILDLVRVTLDLTLTKSRVVTKKILFISDATLDLVRVKSRVVKSVNLLVTRTFIFGP